MPDSQDKQKQITPTPEWFMNWRGGCRSGNSVQSRTEFVIVNELRDIGEWKDTAAMSKGGDIVFEVRGLTGKELFDRDEIRQKENDAIFEGLQMAMFSSDKHKMKDAAQRVLGVYPEKEGKPDSPELEAKKFVLSKGIIKPKLKLWMVSQMMHFYPVALNRVANKILELTGLGATVKKKP